MPYEEIEKSAKTTKNTIERFSDEKEEFIKLLREENKKLPDGQKDKLFNLAVQIVTAGKANEEKCISKIDGILGDLAEKEYDIKVENKLTASINKINKRFELLNKFMEEYRKAIDGSDGLKKTEQLEKIELEHIKESLEDVSELFKNIKEVLIEKEGNKIAQNEKLEKEWENNLKLLNAEEGEEVSTKIIPTLGELFGALGNLDASSGILDASSKGPPRYNLKTPFGIVEVELSLSGQAGSGKAGSGKAGSGKAGSGKADLGKAGSGKADSGKANSGQAGSGKADSGKANSGQADSGKANSGQAGSGKANSGKAGSGKANSGKVGSGKANSGKANSGKAGYGVEILIYTNDKKECYDDICPILDSLFSSCSKEAVMEYIITPIIEYLKHGTVKKTEIEKIIKSVNDGNTRTNNDPDGKKSAYTLQDILDMLKSEKEVNLHDMTEAFLENSPQDMLKRDEDGAEKCPIDIKKVIEAAASLSGILMLAESCKYRNPTFGKLERNAMKSVVQLLQEDHKKPFAKIFNNESGRYVPAHNDGGNMQTQELLYYNREDNSTEKWLVTMRLEGLWKKTYTIGQTPNTNLLKEILLSENNETKKELKEVSQKYDKFRPLSFIKDRLMAQKVEKEIGNKVFDKLKQLFPEKDFPTYDEVLTKTKKDNEPILNDLIELFSNKKNLPTNDKVKDMTDVDKEAVRESIGGYNDNDSLQKREFVRYITEEVMKKDKIVYINQQIEDAKDQKEFYQKNVLGAQNSKTWDSFKFFNLFEKPNEYTKLKKLPRIKGKFFKDQSAPGKPKDRTPTFGQLSESKYIKPLLVSNSNGLNWPEEIPISKIMESRMNKNFKRLYKSQNQTSTKEKVEKVLEECQ